MSGSTPEVTVAHGDRQQEWNGDRVEDEIDLGRYIRPLRRYWKLVLVGAIVGAVTGFVVSLGRPTRYEAATTLLVQQAASVAALSTSRALLENYTLASQTISEIGLDKDPYRLTPQRFVDDVLSVEEVGGTHLLRVKARLPEPNLAAQASRLLSKKAVELNRQVATEGTTAVRIQLKVLLDDAAERLKTAEQQLLAQRSQAQVEVLRKDTEAMLKERGDLLKLLIDIEVEKSRLAAAEKEIQRHQPMLAVGRSVDSEDALRRAGRASMSGARAEQIPALTGAVDPELLDLSNPFVNPVYQTLAFQIATSRTRLAGMERERQEMVSVRKLGGDRFSELTDLYRREIEIERLQNNYDLAKRVYNDLTVRYEQSRTESVGNMVQLQIVDEAMPPDRPMPRKRAEFALLGLTAGFLVAALLALAMNRQEEATDAGFTRPS